MNDDAIRDLFAPLAPITIRRMFGGKGIYRDGLIFALEVDGEILLKADRETAGDFEAAGSRQWSYVGKKKPVKMPYWSIPDAALDDPDEMEAWSRKAWGAALRARG